MSSRTWTFKLEPAELKITIGAEPAQLYIPGATMLLLDRHKWTVSRIDYDTDTVYLTRTQPTHFNFSGGVSNDESSNEGADPSTDDQGDGS